MIWTAKKREFFRTILVSAQDLPWPNWIAYHDEIKLPGAEDFRSKTSGLARLPGFQISGIRYFRSVDSPYWSWVQIVRFRTIKQAEFYVDWKLLSSVRMNPSANLLGSYALKVDPVFPHSKSIGLRRSFDTPDGPAIEKLLSFSLGHFVVFTQLAHVENSEPASDDLIRIGAIQATRIAELASKFLGGT